MKTALEFSEIHAGMLAEVGGKAANLGELTRATLPVPPGWVLTTDAYHQAAEAAGLQEIIAQGGDLATKARQRLLETAIPDEVAEEVRKAYAGLGESAPVAVRSSATAEDLPFASFAGQQDTFLNVVGPEEVLLAVRKCWASLWTDRAVAYREANGIDHAVVRIAVVVQTMVDAQVAGVMFTANPVTGRRREAVIDAGPGLGEAVVSGAVNPDRFVVDVATAEIRERHAGDKKIAIRSLPGGGTERVETDVDGFCLTDAQVRALAELGARVEGHYGAPQDTEWAIDAGGRLWLTQARPITTLYPLPEMPETGHDGLRLFFSINVAQGVMGPFTPMGSAGIKLMSADAARIAGYPPADPHEGAGPLVEAGQRLWIDLTKAARSRVGRAVLPRMFSVAEARTAVLFNALMDDPRLSMIYPSRRPFLRAARRIARAAGAPRRVRWALTRPERALTYSRRIGDDLTRRLELPPDVSPQTRIDHAERLLGATFPMIFSIMPIVVAGYGMFGLASKLSGVPISDMQDVLRSMPNNPTTEMDMELWRLATRIEPFGDRSVDEITRLYQAGQLPRVTQEAISGFLATYGHRGVAEIDLGVKRWSDDPSHIIGVLANYLRMDDRLAPDALFARGAADAQAAVEHIVAAAARKGRWRAAIVRRALDRTRRLGGLRELPKYYAVLIFAGVRRSMRVVGEHLVAQGVLGTPDDIYFLTFRETRTALTDGSSLGGLVAERKAAYEQETRRRHVPRLLLSDGTEPEALSIAAADGAITGTPASAGIATGPARVVMDPVGAHLEPGEILVCPSTDPGWTPLFLTAGGLVMEMGGAMSHGAVVAREYGIPAVVGVARATERVTTGETVTVDGAAGTITQEAAGLTTQEAAGTTTEEAGGTVTQEAAATTTQEHDQAPA
ncbi:PEP/pyruvate-binding domain-containing protein [Nonomuraea endophytica]|uniref:PEP/pyruvate-binding domain-containing protein n=1 Tax=Nonomuraea endophytica TaxID=714136 RepID=UPI0037CA41E9